MPATPRKKAKGAASAAPKPSQEEAKVDLRLQVLALEADIRNYEYPEGVNSDREKIAFANIAGAISTYRNALETNARLIVPELVEA